ncbi:hypothetical protein [Saccharicrinis sp. FJH54]|uniref:hypothetical protein n=1 Tax=Saccharicrinis sp. FJH54 TaxID=3344665 RepID=UPI0035D45CEA
MNLNSKTSNSDLFLFNKLGLVPFDIDDQDKHYLGIHTLDSNPVASIKIFVTCMPAQFWEFEVTTIEGQKYVLQTGSGPLSIFWESIVLVAQNMLSIRLLN